MERQQLVASQKGVQDGLVICGVDSYNTAPVIGRDLIEERGDHLKMNVISVNSTLRARVTAKCQVALAYVLIFALGLSGGIASALEVRDLYLIEVPVASQSDSERTKAVRKGLEQVIVRVTGASTATTDTYITQQLTRAQDYLQQFNYVSVEELGESGELEVIRKLKLQFDESLVNDLLRAARLSIWGSNRPSLLLWVVREQDGQREFIGADERDLFTHAISTASGMRGVPIVYPLLDLEDQVNLSPLEAWGLFQDRIEQASVRYAPAAILAGRAFQDAAGNWQGSWLFIFNDRTFRFQMSGASLDGDIRAAIDEAADQLAEYYAVNTLFADRARLQMSVIGIDSVTDYDRVSKYLDRLAAVSGIGVAWIMEDEIVFTIDTDVSRDKFREELALDNKLSPVVDVGVDPGPDAIIRYRWRLE